MYSARYGWLVVILTALGCGASDLQTPPPSAPAPVAPPTSAEAQPEKAPDQPAAKAPEPKYDVDMVPARMGEPIAKEPRIRVDGPGFDQFIPSHVAQNYYVRFSVQNWEAMPEGSYVQMVLDNKPYRPVTDLKSRVTLSQLAGSDTISDGEHVLAVFVSRPTGESIKGENALAVRRFWVGKRDGDTYRSRDPMLILGSPHTAYEGAQANDILVDFYVLNTVLGSNDYSVRTLLTGPGVKEGGIHRLITEWRPYIILSAHDGDYTLEAELLDKDGNVAPGPWNSVKRTFSVKR